MKYINKILIICLVLGSSLLISCKHTYIYDENDSESFIDAYYDFLALGKDDFVAIDLRNLNYQYAQGHLKGFRNYQYELDQKSKEDDLTYQNRCSSTFLSWMKKNVNKKTTIFLLDNDGTIVLKEAPKLKASGYQNIYLYLGGYNQLISNNQKIQIITGSDDCQC